MDTLDRSIFTLITRDRAGTLQIHPMEIGDAETITGVVQAILEIEDRFTRIHSVTEMNPAEQWCRDVSVVTAQTLLGRYESDDQLPGIVRCFVDDVCGAGYSFQHYRM